MPIQTRTTKKMLPAKRSYDEMTSDEDSDSDYYPQEKYDTLIDELEEIKEQLESAKAVEKGLIDALVDERENVRDLELQLNEWIQKYETLEANQKETDKLIFYTHIALLVLFSIGLTMFISACY